MFNRLLEEKNQPDQFFTFYYINVD